jgi:hypothetical protein
VADREDEPEDLDLDLVLAEIREEVVRRRAAGDFPPSLERELDLAFDRYVPAGTVSSDFREAIAAADRAAYMNVAVPTESQKPGVGEVKRVLRKAMAWYLNYLAQQTTAFATTSVRAMRALGERLAVVEDQLAEWRPELDDTRDRPPEAPDLEAWIQSVLGHVRGAPGRVLHAECGEGRLVRAMMDAGLDAYGVEPRGPLVDRAVADQLEAWPDEPVSHLASVADGFLGGIVLSGCLDRVSLSRQRRLVDLAWSKLAPGGRVVLLACQPERWAEAVPVLEADLAPGRPLHAVTWAHLLERTRFGGIQIIDGRADVRVAILAQR